MRIKQISYTKECLHSDPFVCELLDKAPVTLLKFNPEWHEAISTAQLGVLLSSFPFHVIEYSSGQYGWLNPNPAAEFLLSHPGIHTQKLHVIIHEPGSHEELQQLVATLLLLEPALTRRKTDGLAPRCNAISRSLKALGVKPPLNKTIADLAGFSPSNLRKGADDSE